MGYFSEIKMENATTTKRPVTKKNSGSQKKVKKPRVIKERQVYHAKNKNYENVIVEGISVLNDRKGATLQAVFKYMKDEYEMDHRPTFNKAMKKLQNDEHIAFGKTKQRVKLTFDPIKKEGAEKRKHNKEVARNKKARQHKADVEKNKKKKQHKADVEKNKKNKQREADKKKKNKEAEKKKAAKAKELAKKKKDNLKKTAKKAANKTNKTKKKSNKTKKETKAGKTNKKVSGVKKNTKKSKNK